MLDRIEIDETKLTPRVLLDLDKGYMLIRGSSYSEDPFEVYQKILDWIDERLAPADCEVICDMGFDFINSSSHKYISHILLRLQKIYMEGRPVTVNWLYEEYDEDMKELGADFVDIMSVPIHLKVQEAD